MSAASVARHSSLVLFVSLIAMVLAGCTNEVPVKADLVLTNAKVWTVDKTSPQAEAVAIWREKILAVGSVGEIAVPCSALRFCTSARVVGSEASK